ncbi:BadF/BadG/BcrA/BcrD ATPase family protein [Paractinoplanes ferrugineus]|uniref:N-acetylglucosamine kinase n=1 Tax=Paractinoplanes ferrugineus TaxID=113564 RepID=A0A919JFS1_9ACTN|nr:BadF/BadG/BcrA/BcrD ATPase family protein [Actinoplanes ferrugineus]GIE16401.1 N-acetylglucosamine kinase [Actinoplanes ferrugineus]
MRDELVIGVDAGGTTSRAVVATTTGVILGRGTAGPGNPVAEGALAAAGIGDAIKSAMSGHDPAGVVAATLGIAGTSVTAHPVIADAFAAMWERAGLTCPMSVVGDVITAFAAGTPAADGVVLIAGTGAIAAEIRGHAITRTVDGHGWLLGDEGGGRWIGLRAVRAAVRQWPAPFATRIAAHLGVATADELIPWAQALPLAAIGGLAPIVCAAARAGDPIACRIVADAVHKLLRTLDALLPAGPTVLAGGLLTADTPVRDGVLAALAERGAPAHTAGDPAAAAAWLAARSPAHLHRAFLDSGR